MYIQLKFPLFPQIAYYSKAFNTRKNVTKTTMKCTEICLSQVHLKIPFYANFKNMTILGIDWMVLPRQYFHILTSKPVNMLLFGENSLCGCN